MAEIHFILQVGQLDRAALLDRRDEVIDHLRKIGIRPSIYQGEQVMLADKDRATLGDLLTGQVAGPEGFICPRCGRQVDHGAAHCGNCGVRFVELCQRCGDSDGPMLETGSGNFHSNCLTEHLEEAAATAEAGGTPEVPEFADEVWQRYEASLRKLNYPPSDVAAMVAERTSDDQAVKVARHEDVAGFLLAEQSGQAGS